MTNKLPKAFFIDIDGTLSGHGKIKNMHYNDKMAIRSVVRDGSYVVLTTGRSFEDLYDMWVQINDVNKERTAYVISSNGSKISNLESGEIINEILFSEEQFNQIVDFLYEGGVTFRHSGQKNFWAKEKTLMSKAINKFYSPGMQLVKREEIKFYKEGGRKFGMMVSLGSRKTKMFAEKIKEKFDFVEVHISGRSNYIEIGPKGANKGFAILKLCEYLNIDPKECVHIGDSNNDIPAFNVVGIKVAVKNGMKEVKKQADFVTGKMKKGGVGDAINEIRRREKK